MASVPCGRRERSTTGALGLPEAERPQRPWSGHSSRADGYPQGREPTPLGVTVVLGVRPLSKTSLPWAPQAQMSGTDPALASRAPRRLCGSSLGQCPAWALLWMPEGLPEVGVGPVPEVQGEEGRSGGGGSWLGLGQGRRGQLGRDSWAGGRFAPEGLCEGSARWVRLSEEETEVETGVGGGGGGTRGTGT